MSRLFNKPLPTVIPFEPLFTVVDVDILEHLLKGKKAANSYARRKARNSTSESLHIEGYPFVNKVIYNTMNFFEIFTWLIVFMLLLSLDRYLSRSKSRVNIFTRN
ncbi:hypothetical protein JYQ62_18890 [Nostoc sp. UHCC 0702]|nr:hypothetical protein JYQ62_18890 [Nostoc sp. UHCC 0702]